MPARRNKMPARRNRLTLKQQHALDVQQLLVLPVQEALPLPESPPPRMVHPLPQRPEIPAPRVVHPLPARPPPPEIPIGHAWQWELGLHIASIMEEDQETKEGQLAGLAAINKVENMTMAEVLLRVRIFISVKGLRGFLVALNAAAVQSEPLPAPVAADPSWRDLMRSAVVKEEFFSQMIDQMCYVDGREDGRSWWNMLMHGRR